ILRMRTLLNGILMKHTGQPLERIVRDTDRNFYLTAEQAVEYGLVDEVLTGAKAAAVAGAGAGAERPEPASPAQWAAEGLSGRRVGDAGRAANGESGIRTSRGGKPAWPAPGTRGSSTTAPSVARARIRFGASSPARAPSTSATNASSSAARSSTRSRRPP